MKELFDSDIIQDISTKLISEGSNIKSIIFDNKVLSKPLRKGDLISFKNYVNEFLKYWDDYSLEISQALSTYNSIDTDVNIRSLDYNYIKEFIYNSYDYAALIKFIEGVMTGNKDGKIKSVEDIDDFCKHTISLAFKRPELHVSELVNILKNNSYESYHNRYIDDSNKHMFDNVKHYPELFPKSTKTMIYRTITSCIDYILDEKRFFSNDESSYFQEQKLYISFINNTVDFIMYTLALYSIRIFLISKYVSPFLNCEKSITESFIYTPDNSEDVSYGDKGIFRNYDDLDVKDISNRKHFFTIFNDLMRSLDLESTTKRYGEHIYPNNDLFEEILKSDNLFASKLKDNLLIINVINSRCAVAPNVQSHVIDEVTHNITRAMYNKYQGIGGTSCARDELLYVIKSVDKVDLLSINGIKKHIGDLYEFSYFMSKLINDTIYDISCMIDHHINHHTKPNKSRNDMLTISSKARLEECNYFFIELYREFMFAVLQKLRYLELEMNKIQTNNVDSIINMLKLNPPSAIDSDIDHHMNMSVPSTLRNPSEGYDIYAKSIFESLEMYDKYLKTLPEFSSIEYLSEAGVSDLVNAIIAMLKSVFNSINTFFKNFKPASDWVTQNEKELLSLTFDADAKLENVYKYNLSIPQGFDNIAKNLQSLDVEAAQKDIDAFTKSLYPNERVYDWFKNDGNTAVTKYNNLVLFSKVDVATEIPPEKELSGEALKNEFERWVHDIKLADTIFKNLTEKNKAIDSAFSNVKSKMVQVQNTTTQSQNVTNTQNNSGSNKDDIASTNTNTTNVKASKAGGEHPELVTKIQNVITNIWDPLYKDVLRVLRDEYGYIKAAYSIRNKSTTSQATDKKDAT